MESCHLVGLCSYTFLLFRLLLPRARTCLPCGNCRRGYVLCCGTSAGHHCCLGFVPGYPPFWIYLGSESFYPDSYRESFLCGCSPAHPCIRGPSILSRQTCAPGFHCGTSRCHCPCHNSEWVGRSPDCLRWVMGAPLVSGRPPCEVFLQSDGKNRIGSAQSCLSIFDTSLGQPA